MAENDYASTQAKTGSGIRFYFSETADVETEDWVWVQGLKSGSLPSPDKPEIDVSNTDSTVREYIPGLGTIPDMSLEMDWYPGNEVHQRLQGDLLYGNTVRAWKLESDDFSFVFLGYLKSASVSFSLDAAMTVPLTLKVSSQPKVTYKTVSGGNKVTWDSSLAGTESSGAVTGNVTATLSGGANYTSSVANSSDFVQGRDYFISNVPKGLTAKMTKTSNTVLTLTFTGTATDRTDVSNMTVTLVDASFDGSVRAASVKDSTKTGLAITFA